MIRYFWDDEYPRLQGGKTAFVWCWFAIWRLYLAELLLYQTTSGYIWDMIDQGLRQADKKNGKGYYFAYGGDFGEKIHDRQFCCNVSDLSMWWWCRNLWLPTNVMAAPSFRVYSPLIENLILRSQNANTWCNLSKYRYLSAPQTKQSE